MLAFIPVWLIHLNLKNPEMRDLLRLILQVMCIYFCVDGFLMHLVIIIVMCTLQFKTHLMFKKHLRFTLQVALQISLYRNYCIAV